MASLVLDQPQVRRHLPPVPPLGELEADALAVGEAGEAGALDGGDVDEDGPCRPRRAR